MHRLNNQQLWSALHGGPHSGDELAESTGYHKAHLLPRCRLLARLGFALQSHRIIQHPAGSRGGASKASVFSAIGDTPPPDGLGGESTADARERELLAANMKFCGVRL